MTEPATTETVPLSLWARALGMITSPKATYQNVVAAPRPFGILFISLVLFSIAAAVPQMQPEARRQMMDAQVRGMERFGVTVTPEMVQQFEQQSASPLAKVWAIVGPFILFTVLALLTTAIFWALFNVVFGGTASFKQVLAVTNHSYVITALGALAAMPILLYQFKMSFGGPFNLGALAPGLDPSSSLSHFLSAINLFSLWAWVNFAIGLAVLYRRKTMNIAIGLIFFYLVFTYLMSSLFGSFMGS